MPGVERIADAFAGLVLRADPNTHDIVRSERGGRDPCCVAEARRRRRTFRRGTIQIPVHKSAVIANRADQVRAIRGAVQLQRDRFLDARNKNAPVRGLTAIGCAQVKSLPAAVAGGEDCVIWIRWIDLDVEHPVDWR